MKYFKKSVSILNKASLPTDFWGLQKKMYKMILLSFLLTFTCIAIVGGQFFYPFHIIIGMGIYILSWIPFLWHVYLSHKAWRKYRLYSGTTAFFVREKRKLFFGFLFLSCVFIFLVVRPVGTSVFDDLDDMQIKQRVTDDLYQSVTAIDYLETSGDELITSLQTDLEDANTAEDIKLRFDSFLQAVMFSESLSETHRQFDAIPYRLWDERIVSFTIAYSMYVKKYELLHRVMLETSGSEYKKKILNQYVQLYERNNIYSEMLSRYYSLRTRLRINVGMVYMKLFNDTDGIAKAEYSVLHVKSEEGYTYLFNNFDTTALKTGEVVVDSARNKMFDTWLPIQRGVANAMGNTIISDRGRAYLIEDEQIREMQTHMLPGDIMLQRRNWHVSNVGIPGFWTHAALYTGELETMDTYFSELFPYKGRATFTEYLKVVYPEVYTEFQALDTDGNAYAVIESIAPGVVLQSLEASAHADFVVALRPSLTKQDKMLALFKAFGNLGKPYDYNFDFDTRDALVCSELVYDAFFQNLPEKNGLQFEVSTVNGRKIVSPLDIAKKFKSQYGTDKSELSFVYFISSDEATQTASVSTKKIFLESVDWNKFSFLQHNRNSVVDE
jgi:hypothetical protein